jgi:hypothetical protein
MKNLITYFIFLLSTSTIGVSQSVNNCYGYTLKTALMSKDSKEKFIRNNPNFTRSNSSIIYYVIEGSVENLKTTYKVTRMDSVILYVLPEFKPSKYKINYYVRYNESHILLSEVLSFKLRRKFKNKNEKYEIDIDYNIEQSGLPEYYVYFELPNIIK